MLAAIISVIIVGLIFLFAISLAPKIFLYGLVAVALVIKFVARKILIAVPWTIAAFGTVAFGIFALGRQFFIGEDAKYFTEKFLPPREFKRKTFSLTLIELMILLREKILTLYPRLKD